MPLELHHVFTEEDATRRSLLTPELSLLRKFVYVLVGREGFQEDLLLQHLTRHPTPISPQRSVYNHAAMTQNPKRCAWVPKGNTLYEKYHDQDWGVPVHTDRKLFEMLILEGAQAGLSWETILKKRKEYKKAFDNFDVTKVAAYDAKKVRTLLKNPGIVRNKLKIASAIRNAKVFLQIQKECGSFDAYLWKAVAGKPILSARKSMAEIPAKTDLSDAISKDLKKRGMNFVGSTIIYAYMQSIGMVNDHEVTCFRY